MLCNFFGFFPSYVKNCIVICQQNYFKLSLKLKSINFVENKELGTLFLLTSKKGFLYSN